MDELTDQPNGQTNRDFHLKMCSVNNKFIFVIKSKIKIKLANPNFVNLD